MGTTRIPRIQNTQRHRQMERDHNTNKYRRISITVAVIYGFADASSNTKDFLNNGRLIGAALRRARMFKDTPYFLGGDFNINPKRKLPRSYHSQRPQNGSPTQSRTGQLLAMSLVPRIG